MIRTRALAGLVVAFMLFVAPNAYAGDVASLKKKLKGALNADRITRSLQIIQELFKIDSEESIDVVMDVAIPKEWVEIDREVLRWAKGMKNSTGFRHMCVLANKHPDPRVRINLALGFAERPEKAAYKAVLQSLFDPSREVVMAALTALQKRGTLTCMDFLIKALSHYEEQGKRGMSLRIAVRELMADLTGEDLPIADDWRNWWSTKKGTGWTKPRKAKANAGTVVVKDVPKFFGIEVIDQKVLFVLDISGSMEIKDPLPEEAGDRGEGDGKRKGPLTGVAKKEKKKKKKKGDDDDIPASRQRLRRVQKELIQVIEDLPEDVMFNIMTFNHEIGFWAGEGGLRPADNKSKRKAIKFVQEFSAEGETHTDEALESAFDVQGLTAIYLLSDGAPRRGGKLLEKDPIVSWVKENNRYRRIRLHTVGFKQAGGKMRKFMRRLARATGGKYKELR